MNRVLAGFLKGRWGTLLVALLFLLNTSTQAETLSGKVQDQTGQPIANTNLNLFKYQNSGFEPVGTLISSDENGDFSWQVDTPGGREHLVVLASPEPLAEVEARGWQSVLDDVIEEAKNSAPNVLISFDVDVIDPTFVPGTSTPEPGGLYIREVLPLVRRLCAETNVVGFELVELRPDSDPGYTSVQNSSAVLRQCLNGMAVRKAGITEDNYLNPIMTDDGQ